MAAPLHFCVLSMSSEFAVASWDEIRVNSYSDTLSLLDRHFFIYLFSYFDYR